MQYFPKSSKITIAVIDSGVNINHPDMKDCNILELSIIEESGEFECIETVDAGDCLGHGTACSWIIHRAIPSASIVSVKVLDGNGIADYQRVLHALGWCLDHKVDIICFSMGSCSHRHSEQFFRIGEKATSLNIPIIAAMHEKYIDSIPASLPNYIGVYNSNPASKDIYTWDSVLTRAGAYGRKQRVGWHLPPYYALIGGTSFAAAHMTAHVAKLMMTEHINSYPELLHRIAQNASTLEESSSKDEAIDVSRYNADFFEIKHATIFGYTKEMDALIQYPDLSRIEIDQVVDVVRSKRVGRTIDYTNGKFTVCDYKNVTETKSDTLIISKQSALSELIRDDVLHTAISFGLDHGMNIYSLEYVDYSMYPNLYKIAEQKHLTIRHPFIGERDLAYAKSIRYSCGHIGTDVPIVGIFGTGTSQGKFTLQLKLRKQLLSRGYRIKNLGTEMHSELFGFESYYPMETLKSIKFSQWDMMDYLQGEVRRLELESPKPDLIIVGSQSGTIPKTYAIESSIYTLPSISFLMGTIPHVYVLVINHNDEISYVKDTIVAMEAIGKGKVICACFSDKIKTPDSTRMLKPSELTAFQSKWCKELGIPVYPIRNVECIMDTIIAYFS